MEPAHDQLAADRFNDAFNQKDVGAGMAMATPDIVFENTSGRRFEGQEAVRVVLGRAFQLMSRGWSETEEVLTVGDRVVVLWRYLFDKGQPAQGSVRGIDVFRVRAGLAAEKLSYVRSEDFVHRLGLTLPGS